MDIETSSTSSACLHIESPVTYTAVSFVTNIRDPTISILPRIVSTRLDQLSGHDTLLSPTWLPRSRESHCSALAQRFLSPAAVLTADLRALRVGRDTHFLSFALLVRVVLTRQVSFLVWIWSTAFASFHFGPRSRDWYQPASQPALSLIHI